jgi:UDP-N-acetylglucosamine 1-carboxyvinyltransferase
LSWVSRTASIEQELDTFEVEGGHRLKGELVPQGAKNEALQVLCACLLTDEPVTISNLPEIRDVLKLIELMRGLRVGVEQLGPDAYRFRAAEVDLDFFHTSEFRRAAGSLRGSVMLIGALLARYGHAYLPQPGGDKIGRRRLDTHFIGLQKLGARFDYDPVAKAWQVDARRLRGTYLLMDEISVTGTANVYWPLFWPRAPPRSITPPVSPTCSSCAACSTAWEPGSQALGPTCSL